MARGEGTGGLRPGSGKTQRAAEPPPRGLAPQDLLTVVRFLAVPILWVLAIRGDGVALGIGLALAGTTDVLDGMLARRANRTTSFGSRLDTLADLAVMLSALVWFELIDPSLYREQAPLMLVWGALALAGLAIGYVRFRRWADLHLLSSKASAFLGYVFAIHLFIFGGYSRLLFGLAMAASIISSIESLLVQLRRRSAEDRPGTILFHRRR